jgi:hypothetical protein
MRLIGIWLLPVQRLDRTSLQCRDRKSFRQREFQRRTTAAHFNRAGTRVLNGSITETYRNGLLSALANQHVSIEPGCPRAVFGQTDPPKSRMDLFQDAASEFKLLLATLADRRLLQKMEMVCR